MKQIYLSSSILIFGLFALIDSASYKQMEELYKNITGGKNNSQIQ